MKPVAFDYEAPSAVDEVVRALAAPGRVTQLLAGGQTLVPRLNRRQCRPEMLIDLGGVTELRGIALGPEVTRIGATVTLSALLAAQHDREELRVLAAAARTVGNAEVRNRSTFGGTVAAANPAGQIVTTLIALGARLTLRSLDRVRTIGCLEAVTCDRPEPDELIYDVLVPRHAGGSTGFSMVGGAERVCVGIAHADALWRIAVGGLGDEVRLFTSVGPEAVLESDLGVDDEFRCQLARVALERARAYRLEGSP